MATKQEIIRHINTIHPNAVRLNTKDTSRIVGGHPNQVPAYMQGYLSEKKGNQRFYFIADIAERMWKGSTT